MKLLLFLIISFSATLCYASQVQYHLDVSFQTDTKRLDGTATINFPAGEKWDLFTNGLQINSIRIQEEGKAPFALPIPQGNTISMYAGTLKQQVTISYTLQTQASDFNNRINGDGIALTSSWHPVPDRAVLFSLTASLPEGFKGISESDNLDREQKQNRLSTSFSQPVRAIHLAAGPYQIRNEEIRKGLSLSTWFFAEDVDLSQGYLDAAKEYILRYEGEIGPFPYNHYEIVANRLPTGFGMPTFTLLGQRVLRLPFIKETSLGHEVLHSWFGNSIEVADDSANWCEGLTSYLADFSYAADKAKGAEHRKDSMINYQSYIHPENAIAVNEFRSASHNQAMAKAVRAVGYNRTAMFFHQLRGLLGPEDFTGGIRFFASSMQGRPAGWNDIKTAFETASKRDLSFFFNEQLTRKDTPTLEIADLHTENKQDQSILHFRLLQKSEQPYTLQVPIRVMTFAGETTFIQTISEKETAISLTLDQPPLSFAIDPQYDIFRTLRHDELPPTWSRFMGAKNRLVITDKQDKESLDPFLQWAEQQGWTIIDSESATNKQLTENSILFTNSSNAAYAALFGEKKETVPGFQLTVQVNPLNENEVVVLLSSSDQAETGAALRKLKHYGKYSRLTFAKGHIQEKSTAASLDGLIVLLEEMPMGGVTSSLRSFDQILTELSSKRVIYLGETHDSLADHLLQFRIIQALQKKGLDLAIAMEMFPVSSQGALDEYVLDKDIDETEFLRDSRWFDVWRFDWRLFRPTFNFCRTNNIPVYGINVDRKIVSTVFKDGHTDDLDEDQQETIAKERDLGMDGYVERLQMVHGFHAKSPHGNNGIAGFVQSQAIWDESMAENIVRILQDTPEKTVIVIAGSQHTRKDSGIPPRLLRRMPIEQASVLNLFDNNAPTDPATQADFFFMAKAGSLEAKGKIGVILVTEKDEDEEEHLRISGISPAGKAGTAGLKENDIIISIDNEPVQNMEDIGILMMDSRAGDILLVKVKRKLENGDSGEIEIKVELSDLSKPAGHP